MNLLQSGYSQTPCLPEILKQYMFKFKMSEKAIFSQKFYGYHISGSLLMVSLRVLNE